MQVPKFSSLLLLPLPLLLHGGVGESANVGNSFVGPWQ
jgi:hypothetical protein